jgi:segregation and condensation protein A
LAGNLIKITEDLGGYGTQPFEGPLDLLLYLIRQDEIDIYDIPIAQITHQYLAYLEAMRELDLEIAGEFILMASMLIRIKSQMLLPKTGEPEEEIEDPRSELVAALLEYKRYKQAAEDLEQKGDQWLKRYARGDNPEIAQAEVNYVLKKVDLAALMVAFSEVLERAEIQHVHHVAVDDILIEDRIRHIARLLTESEGVEFCRLFEDDQRRLVIVVTFMALLELARLGQISIKQASLFGKIWVYPVNLQVEEAIKLYAETS